jgi:uncharacterized membrane protein YdjX (TVP38/TMEM64 family)
MVLWCKTPGVGAQMAEGWKIILLLRLSPIVPWNLLNIAMASTNVPFWQFTIASAVGAQSR